MINKVYTREIIENIKIKKIFDNLHISSKVENNIYNLPFNLEINTPYGFKKINILCTTEKIPSVTSYFSNGKTLVSSDEHKLKVNGDWKLVKDIKYNTDIIETKRGITTLKKRIKKNKKHILYDLEVDKVHCFYGNEILSHNTWVLCDVGAHAIKKGLTVNHYTLELSETMVARRYYSALTGIASHDLPYNIDEIKHKIKIVGAKGSHLTIKEYPTKGASVNTIRAHVDKCTKFGNKPHIILVDYGDLLKAPQYYKEKRLELGNIFEELRGLAGEVQAPVWTASQANRSGADTDIISGEQISEDYSKIMIGDFIFSVSRKVEDQVHKTARVFMIKNRFGVDKITFPAKFDVSNGNLNIYEEKSIQGQQLKGNMDKKEKNVRKILKDKFYSGQKKTD